MLKMMSLNEKGKCKMIIDVTGTILTPGNNGDDCLGNGEHIDKNGKPVPWCCDECDYYLECFPEEYFKSGQ